MSDTPGQLQGIGLDVLVLTRSPGSVQAVAVDFISRDVGRPTGTLGGIHELLSVINRRNNTKLTLNEVAFSLPAKRNDPVYNTEVVLTAKPSSGLRGSVTMAYRRPPLSEVVDVDLLAQIEVIEPTTTHPLLPQINALLGIRLTPEDVNDLPVLAGETPVLEVAASSYYFIPDIDPTPHLEDIVNQRKLSGFTVPVTALDDMLVTRKLQGFVQRPKALSTMLPYRKLNGFYPKT